MAQACMSQSAFNRWNGSCMQLEEGSIIFVPRQIEPRYPRVQVLMEVVSGLLEGKSIGHGRVRSILSALRFRETTQAIPAIQAMPSHRTADRFHGSGNATIAGFVTKKAPHRCGAFLFLGGERSAGRAWPLHQPPSPKLRRRGAKIG